MPRSRKCFEFNDEITRSNFINIVEPYLRDVQSKRGLYDFLVICDETNNTPDVIDNNEFRGRYLPEINQVHQLRQHDFRCYSHRSRNEEVAGRV